MASSEGEVRESLVEDRGNFLSRFAGCVFDCDGTLVNSMPGHLMAWRKVLAEFGLGSMSDETFYGTAGMPVTDILELLCITQQKKPIDPAPFVARKAAIYEEQVLPMLETIPVVVEIALAAKKQGIPIAVASGGDRTDVLESLKRCNIDVLFDTVVTREDVTHGKPAPDTFILAAQRLGVEPERCLGFEDADKGMDALRNAGMTAVDVRLLEEYPLPEFLRERLSAQSTP